MRSLPKLAIVGSLLLAAALALEPSLRLGGDRSTAQAQSISPCQPPQQGEYLVMVTQPTSDSQARLQQMIPRGTTSTICNYFGTPVSRIGGFNSSQSANSWAQYLSEIGGFRTFVARAGNTATPTARPSPSTPSPSTASVLGQGYAVLVNGGDRPNAVAEVQRTSGRRVNVVLYEQRRYLLAIFTADAAVAANVMSRLSEQGLASMIVDGRWVTQATVTNSGQ